VSSGIEILKIDGTFGWIRLGYNFADAAKLYLVTELLKLLKTIYKCFVTGVDFTNMFARLQDEKLFLAKGVWQMTHRFGIFQLTNFAHNLLVK